MPVQGGTGGFSSLGRVDQDGNIISPRPPEGPGRPIINGCFLGCTITGAIGSLLACGIIYLTNQPLIDSAITFLRATLGGGQ